MSNIAVQIQGMSYLYSHDVKGIRRGIDSLSLQLLSTKVYGVIGPNGAGKTTLFKLLSGRLFPQKGHLYFYDQAVTRLPLWKRVRLGLGYLSQTGTLVENMSVEWNLHLAQTSVLEWRKLKLNSEQSIHHWDATGLNHNFLSVLKTLRVEYTVAQKVESLSGGEKRRVELARLLLMRPKILLLDEPFAALDEAGCQAVIDLVQQAREWGAMVLIIDHHKKYIEAICDEIIYLDEGKQIYR